MSQLSKSDLISQLSEDWRSRDRMTWQMPAIIVVIGGTILVSAYSSTFARDVNTIRHTVLTIGLLFNWVVTLFLTRNMYLQGLGQHLIKKLTNEERVTTTTRECALRIPMHTSDYTIGKAFVNFLTPFSAISLLILSSFLTGIFASAIFGGVYFWCGFSACWGEILLVFGFSHCILNDLGKKDAKLLRFVPVVLFFCFTLVIVYFAQIYHAFVAMIEHGG